MLRQILLLLPLFVTTAFAQTAVGTAAPFARSNAKSDTVRTSSTRAATLDSIRLAQDSILAHAHSRVALDSSAVDELEKIAMIYKERKRFAMQLQIAMRMTETNPASALAHLVYGDALLDNDQPERAIAALSRALVIAPNYVRARVMLAETFEILQKPDSAMAQLDTALLHNPRHANAHMQLAKLLTKRGQHAEAADHYRTACELLPDAPSSYGPWMKLADALIANYAYTEAIDALRYCMRLQPTSPDPYLLMAEVHEKSGDTSKAIRAYLDFSLRFPTDDRALDAERAALRLRYPSASTVPD
ncbi:MAG: tetratricopeptide repeat protein [bacterium]|nr:tetratricopeptide repeat protein [Candidatus Kapabacteria bacterium]